MRKIFVTGGSGLLGKYLLQTIPQEVFVNATFSKNPVTTTEKNVEFLPLDITDKKSVLEVVCKIKPEVIIHTASLGNVDYCEKNKDEAWSINVIGTRNIIESAKEVGAILYFSSSNAIYDGTTPPYAEESMVNPVDYYGQTKVQSEEDIKKSGITYSILRLMTMYGWNNPYERPNPVSWLIDNLKQGKKLPIVNDIYNNYLFAKDAALTIWRLIEINIMNQTYNVAGPEIMSRYALAEKVCEEFTLNKEQIFPVTSDYFPSIAPRPKNTSFDIHKLQKLDIQPLSVGEGLKTMHYEKS